MTLLIPATQCVLHMVSVGEADKQLSFWEWSVRISIFLLKNCFFKGYEFACLFQCSSKGTEDFTVLAWGHKSWFASHLKAARIFDKIIFTRHKNAAWVVESQRNNTF